MKRIENEDPQQHRPFWRLQMSFEMYPYKNGMVPLVLASTVASLAACARALAGTSKGINCRFHKFWTCQHCQSRMKLQIPSTAFFAQKPAQIAAEPWAKWTLTPRRLWWEARPLRSARALCRDRWWRLPAVWVAMSQRDGEWFAGEPIGKTRKTHIKTHFCIQCLCG